MEQIQNGILYMLQTMTQAQQTAQAAPKAEQAGDFQKLMEQKARQTGEDTAARPQAAEDGKEQETAAPEEQEMSAALNQEAAFAQFAASQVHAPAQTGQPAIPARQPVQAAEGQQAIPAAQTAAQAPVQMERAVLEHKGQMVSADPAVWTQAAAQARHLAPEAQLRGQAQTQAQPQNQNVENPLPGQPQAVTAEQTAGSQTEQPKGSLPQGTGEADMKVEVQDASGEGQALFGQLEAVPVKVGETTAAARGEQAPNVEEQLGGKLTQALDNGQTKVEITLTPESLGTVKVEIVRQENGAVQVVLSAENSQTRTLLERHAANLQTLLGSHSQENVQVEVQRQQASQQHEHSYDGHNGGDQGQQQQQERDRRQERGGQDFLQQLRLGLIPLDGEAS